MYLECVVISSRKARIPYSIQSGKTSSSRFQRTYIDSNRMEEGDKGERRYGVLVAGDGVVVVALCLCDNEQQKEKKCSLSGSQSEWITGNLLCNVQEGEPSHIWITMYRYNSFAFPTRAVRFYSILSSLTIHLKRNVKAVFLCPRI